MKKAHITLLFILLSTAIFAQIAPTTVTFHYDPIVVFQDNVITVDVEMRQPVSTGSTDHLFVAIDLASHATSGTDFQVVYNSPDVAVISNVAYIDLGASSFSPCATCASVVVSKTFTLHLNCGAIQSNFSVYNKQDDIFIS